MKRILFGGRYSSGIWGIRRAEAATAGAAVSPDFAATAAALRRKQSQLESQSFHNTKAGSTNLLYLQSSGQVLSVGEGCRVDSSLTTAARGAC